MDSSGYWIRQHTWIAQAGRLNQAPGQPFTKLGKSSQQGAYECRGKPLPFRGYCAGGPRLEYSTEVTQFMAALFFWFRLVHAVVFISGLNRLMIRTVIFSVSNIAMLVYGVVVLLQLF